MSKGRLEAFSDGVIAIIITIMVLELKAPHSDRLNALRPLTPAFVSYVLSFIYIGIYWNNHHFKGFISIIVYAVAIPLSFLNPWVAFSLYVLVAILWFIPDRRIENAFRE